MDGAGPSADPEPVIIPDTFFSGLTYHIASSFPTARAEELDAALRTYGGTRAEGVHDERLNLVVADSPVWEGWEVVEQREREARENEPVDGTGDGAQPTSPFEPKPRKIEVVTDKWVDRSLLMGKLQLAAHYSTNPSHIFSGVVACATGLPATDLEVISAGITGLGGQWRTGLTKEVTHLFAIAPDSAKYATALHFQPETHIKVLLPHWFDDAVRLGNGNLSTEEYEWPEPRMLKGIDAILPPVEAHDDDGAEVSPEKQRERQREEMKRNMYATAALFAPAMGTSSPPSAADISLVSKHILSLSSPLRHPLDHTTPTKNVGADAGVPQVWGGRRILLSRTLQLYHGRREAVQKGIERAGGVVVRFNGDDEEEEEPETVEMLVKDDAEGAPEGAVKKTSLTRLSRREEERRRAEDEAVEECDVLVTRWRYGRAYVKAIRAKKTVGTLAWLFHVQSTGVLARPLDQLLHYPVPKRVIEGFANHKITVTNYTGEAREYLKKLIAVMGATFTPSMSIANTVLIAAHTSGTKATKAHSWSIPVVNHTWLEDCFVQWRNLTPALERYIVFPPGVDFSALLGGRGIWVGSAEASAAAATSTAAGVGVSEKEKEKEKGENDKEKSEKNDAERKKVLNRIENEAEDVASLMDQEDVLSVAYEQQLAQAQAAAAAAIGNGNGNAVQGQDQPGANGDDAPPDASEREVQALMGGGDDRAEDAMMDVDPQAGEWEFPPHLAGGEKEDAEDEAQEESTPKPRPKPKPKAKPTTTATTKKPVSAGSVIELEDSDEEEEGTKKTKKASAAKPKSTPKTKEQPTPSAPTPKKSLKESMKPKPKPKTPAKKTPIKKRTPPRAVSEVTSVEDEPEDPDVEEEEEEEEEEDVRGQVAMEDEDEDEDMEDETEDFPSRVIPATSGKAAKKGAEKGKGKEKPTPAKSAGKRRVLVSSSPEDAEKADSGDEGGAMDVDEEEDEEVEVVSKSKSKAKAKVTEKASPVSKSASPKKSTTVAKTTKGKHVVPSSDEDEEDEDEESADEDRRPAAKFTPSKPTPKAKSKPAPAPSPPHLSTPASSNAKAATNGLTLASVSRSEGLLNRPKVDARTRVKKKAAAEKEKEKEKVVVESEDEEEEEVEEVAVKGKGKKAVAKPAPAKGKKAVPPTKEKGKGKKAESSEEEDEEEEPEEEEEEEVRPTRSTKSKSASKPAPTPSAAPAKGKSKAQKPPPSTRSKPLRVYPGSETESEEEAPEDEEDDDESLPPAPHLLSKAEKRRAPTTKEKQKENASASAGRPKPGPASKAKDYMSTPAGKSATKPKSSKRAKSDTEEDEESEEEPVSKPKGKQAPTATPQKGKTVAVSTPKRVMSVLMPSLNLSAAKATKAMASKKGKGKAAEIEEEDEEEVVISSTSKGKGKPSALTTKPKSAKAPPKSTAKSTTMPPPKSRAKGKHAASSEEEDDTDDTREEEEEEEEVSALVSPRTRAVTRTESLRAIADQTPVSSPSKSRGTVSVKPRGKAKVDTSKPTAMEVDEPVAGPSSHPRRTAAAKATQRLHDTLMPDLINFEAQMRKANQTRRTSGRGGLDAFVVDGVDSEGYSTSKTGTRKRGSTQEDEEEDGARKKKRRVSDVADEEEVVIVKKDVKGKAKGKEKVAPMDVDDDVPSSGIMVMTTQVTLGEDTIKALAKLGVKMTTRPGECTHLLARQLVRTEKFLCALASAPWILSEKWALSSASAKRLLPEKDFVLKDKAGEAKYGIDLTKSLRRAKENQGKMLEGHTFYVTPKVPVDTKLLKSVVNACGGQVTTQTPSVRIINASPETRHVISCKEDISIWRPMLALGIKIYTQELLLNGALNQKVEWDRDDLMVQV